MIGDVSSFSLCPNLSLFQTHKFCCLNTVVFRLMKISYTIRFSVLLRNYCAVQSDCIAAQNRCYRTVKNWYSGWTIFVRGILINNENKQADTQIQQCARNNSSKMVTFSVSFSRHHSGQLVPTQTFHLMLK
jgi:hypothetical protein